MKKNEASDPQTSKDSVSSYCSACGAQIGDVNLQCDRCGTKASDDATWPPPPTDGVRIETGKSTRSYLTCYGWLDTVAGIGMGAVFHWFIFYAVTTYILYYLIPHRVAFFWNVLAGCGIALVLSLLVWLRLRLIYRRMADTFLITSFVIGAALTFLFSIPFIG